MGWKAECAVSMAMRMRRRAMVYEVIYRPLMRNYTAGGAINLLFCVVVLWRGGIEDVLEEGRDVLLVRGDRERE